MAGTLRLVLTCYITKFSNHDFFQHDFVKIMPNVKEPATSQHTDNTLDFILYTFFTNIWYQFGIFSNIALPEFKIKFCVFEQCLSAWHDGPASLFFLFQPQCVSGAEWKEKGMILPCVYILKECVFSWSSDCVYLYTNMKHVQIKQECLHLSMHLSFKLTRHPWNLSFLLMNWSHVTCTRL